MRLITNKVGEPDLLCRVESVLKYYKNISATLKRRQGSRKNTHVVHLCIFYLLYSRTLFYIFGKDLVFLILLALIWSFGDNWIVAQSYGNFIANDLFFIIVV